MNPKTLTVLIVLTIAAATVSGCSLIRPSGNTGKDSLLPGIENLGRGKVVEPKRCMLTVSIVSRPLHDPVVNDVIWSAADEQMVGSETRRALQSNGLRIGVIEGKIPSELQTALNAPPPNKVEPAEFNFPDGSNTMLALADSVPEITLLLTRDGKAYGKDYKQATGWFRVTATHAGATGVSLRLVPEIHFGPSVRRFDASQNTAASVNEMNFVIKDGQQEETLRDLSAAITVEPGQTIVMGSDPNRPGSLGAFLFTHAEANSDRLMQKIVIVKASRTNVGIPGSQPSAKPPLFPVDPPSELPPLPRTKSDRAS